VRRTFKTVAILWCLCGIIDRSVAQTSTDRDQRAAALALDLCAAQVGTDPVHLDAAAAGIPGLVLTQPLSIEKFPTEYRDLFSKAMNLPANESLRLASFGGRTSGEGYFAAIRPDAKICYMVARGTPDAPRLIAQGLNSHDSRWTLEPAPSETQSMWSGESRDRTPIALLMRNSENAVVVSVFAKGATLDVTLTDAADKRALSLAEFCGRALLEGADSMPTIAGAIPGLVLSEPQPLSASKLTTRERLGKTLRVSQDTPVRLAAIRDIDTADSYAAIRTDAETCGISVKGTANARALFVDRFGRTDSGWTAVRMEAPFQSGWKRPGRDGDVVSLIIHSQADTTTITLFTWHPANRTVADVSAIATVVVEKCVAAIRDGQPADAGDFAPAFAVARVGKKNAMTTLRAVDETTGLVVGLRYDKKSGPDCAVLSSGSRVPAQKLFNSLVDAFLLQPGASEGELPSKVRGDAPYKVWRVTVADGRSAEMSGSTDGGMLVISIRRGTEK
jgi:hypothetical protein